MTPEQLELIPEEREEFVLGLPLPLQVTTFGNDGFLPAYDFRGRAMWYEARRGLLCPDCTNDTTKTPPHEAGFVTESDLLTCSDCRKVTRNGEWRDE